LRLDAPYITLFDYCVDSLRTALPDEHSPVWETSRVRQQSFQVHRDTRSILFEWLENSWHPGMPIMVEQHSYAPSDLAESVYGCANKLAHHHGGRIVKLMLAELAPGGRILGHIDQAPALREVHRCHVPIVTNPNVIFAIDHHPYYLPAGRAYELDNTRHHAVANNSKERRVHLICDILPEMPKSQAGAA